ncbi:PAS domain S-box protein [Patescibacteria group bacterium]|nr:PAS domain S-box protein [Patescibacteria group bacterium]
MNTSNKITVIMGSAAVVAILLAGIVLRELAVPSEAQLMDARALIGLFALFAVFGIATVTSFLRRAIAQNKKLSEAQEALKKFQLAVERSSEHIVITDLDGRIIYANAAAAATTGYSDAELLGATPAVWGKQMNDDFYRALWKTIKSEKREFFGEMVNRRKNGELYRVEAHIYPLLDPQGNAMFFVGIERDVTERKRLEETRSNFISIASHQLRTPLSAMRWIAELLASGDAGTLTDQQGDLVKDLHRSALRLGALVRGLLNIVRIESAELAVRLEPVDPAAVCAAAIEDQLPRARKKGITISCRGSAPVFSTDPVILREIVRNFLDNALNYTDPGGRITLELEEKEGTVIVAVRDTGMGIPIAQQQMIFTKFFRADNAAHRTVDGSGLGLYIARSLAELLGGKVWFTSEEGSGSAFFAAFPPAAASAQRRKDLLASN